MTRLLSAMRMDVTIQIRNKLYVIGIIAGLLVAGALNACGQKGPLYLPQDAAVPAEPTAVAPMASPVDTAPAMTAPSAEAQEEESEQNKSSAADAEAEDRRDKNTTEPVITK